ncbi:MAG TPA: single-stranded DNA-binding protein [Spirochaetota bacterium]|jgi:single-strand DNA-binding protein|nr:single-stranded DNA-binding protein [Spirochaetota bacterium]HQO00735.1 single-stranded DNA-binding protein [Spirochaetota bacterium]HQP48087.1 single-stranded DNA-binding protein [Spirochaetota bacterium]
MASDINRVILIGRMVKDPELRYTQSGSSVANFSIANNRIYTVSGDRKEYTSFFNCIAWGKLGEAIAQYCKKGQRIGIEGRLQQRTWDDQSGNKRSTVEVVVENFQFLTPKPGQEMSSAELSAPSPEHEDISYSNDNPFSDDDIPF